VPPVPSGNGENGGREKKGEEGVGGWLLRLFQRRLPEPFQGRRRKGGGKRKGKGRKKGSGYWPLTCAFKGELSVALVPRHRGEGWKKGGGRGSWPRLFFFFGLFHVPFGKGKRKRKGGEKRKGGKTDAYVL